MSHNTTRRRSQGARYPRCSAPARCSLKRLAARAGEDRRRFPPGGGTDALACVLAAQADGDVGTTGHRGNRAGVAGVLAADVVAKIHRRLTLLMGHINSHGIGPALNPKMPCTTRRRFLPSRWSA